MNPDEHPIAPAQPAAAPSATEPLAEVDTIGRFAFVRLPADLEAETLVEFASMQQERGQFVTATREPDGRIRMPRSETRLLLRALERCKPERMDEHGCPLPWVPLKPLTVELDGPGAHDLDDDVVFVTELPPDDGEQPITDEYAWVQAESRRLSELLGFPAFPLVVAPVKSQRRGFCGGKIWMHHDGTPLRVVLRPCPNSDHAEIQATLLHELTHALTPRAGHGPAFCLRLVQLAGEIHGAEHFVHAPTAPPCASVDRWLATGIRAAIGNKPPPAPKDAQEGKLIKVISKIRKLHALADAQVGSQEAITACGLANDLVTVYKLGGYELQVAAGLDEQMVDRWMSLPRGAVWRRNLAHEIARFFGVFSLHNAGKRRMHLFGRHADLVATIYLYEVCEAAIARGCGAHLKEWRMQERRARGEAAKERTDFCDAAVRAFRKKLRAIASESDHVGGPALESAEGFAAAEHRKRGKHWGSEAWRDQRTNAAGARLGGSLEVVRGVGGGATRQIAGPK